MQQSVTIKYCFYIFYIYSPKGEKKTSEILEFIYSLELKKIVSRAAAIFISIVCVY